MRTNTVSRHAAWIGEVCNLYREIPSVAALALVLVGSLMGLHHNYPHPTE